MTTSSLPQPLQKATRWRNLALVLGVLYALYAAGAIWSGGLFEYAGVDYRAFRASAAIVVDRGFASVYDLASQEQYQQGLYATYAGPHGAGYSTVPVPYLPPFVALFLPLLLLPPVPSFIAWTVLNAAIHVLYIVRFSRTLGDGWEDALWWGCIVALPVLTNLLFGQVSGWLLVFVGEFLLASQKGREVQAGLWLSGLLLKPQALFLLLPGLLIGRRFKTLAGFTVAGALLGGLSLALAGFSGLTALLQLFLRYTGDLATTNPQLMMGWRMLQVNLAGILPDPVSWGVTIAGLVLTAIAALALWVRPAAPGSPRFVVTVLGTYAATCAFAWHAHWHMAIPLLAPLLWLRAKQRLPQAVLDIWTLSPLVVFLSAFLILSLAAPNRVGLDHNLTGVWMFLLNLFLLAWAGRAILFRAHTALTE